MRVLKADKHNTMLFTTKVQYNCAREQRRAQIHRVLMQSLVNQCSQLFHWQHRLQVFSCRRLMKDQIINSSAAISLVTCDSTVQLELAAECYNYVCTSLVFCDVGCLLNRVLLLYYRFMSSHICQQSKKSYE
jgi:hypothetical protein